MTDRQGAHSGIAQRIRGLIRLSSGTDVAEVASRLGVDERSLRASLENDSRVPATDVIVALIRTYGLDPTWVMTGEYDQSTHRAALEGNTAEIEVAVNRLAAQANRAKASPELRAP